MVSLAKLRDKLSWQWGAVLAALLAVSALAVASTDGSDASAGRVPKPVYFKGKGDKCVRDDAYMRRHHMEELKHHRNETMRQGIRTTEFSLKGCVSCHADPQTHSVLGEHGFCASCHSYAAVTLDCFECHSPNPKPAAPSAGIAQQAPVAPVDPNTTGGTSKNE